MDNLCVSLSQTPYKIYMRQDLRRDCVSLQNKKGHTDSIMSLSGILVRHDCVSNEIHTRNVCDFARFTLYTAYFARFFACIPQHVVYVCAEYTTYCHIPHTHHNMLCLILCPPQYIDNTIPALLTIPLTIMLCRVCNCHTCVTKCT